jgi:ribosomal RNA-processing protein 12
MYFYLVLQSSRRFLNHFRSDSDLHKEMLAILAALTEVIKDRGGSQTSTEYFLALVSSWC